MNRLYIIIFFVFFTSCNDVTDKQATSQHPEGSKAIQVRLIDSLGMINLSIPLRYDTSFSWVHYSDCGKSCDEQKYRFQSKNLRLLKESGWIWQEAKDSVDRFTISHTLDFPFHDIDTAKNILIHNNLKGQILSNDVSTSLVFDTIEKINDRYFSIIAIQKSDTLQLKKVFAVTTIKSNQIKFQFELLTHNNDSINKNFIKNSINLIRTIRFSNGIK